mmetsp:Transcript_33203/g.65177  ORF Transcript_33203/g.65177 Transcript_33203/m.65177 type:complete len:424 (-) Transcript_33203:207-1478(-)|eukprot:CAMPEP_0175127846 /NCGR_PEP_ID=MMETSP0087-20121206/4609_1 /TAXON_ID=136419 /ORGANISM="Unknown Unknown, Strain D1" /LENGTH=423 /DNA_ID=CAMNT_0016409861 /DNA_START=217 /DNA_END=1488 /DNA_ORIENTATION=-
MPKFLASVVCFAAATTALPIVHPQHAALESKTTTDLVAAVSLKGYDITLSKAQQKAFASKTWFELHDKNYNSRGFNMWKPTNTGFLVKSKKGFILDCSAGAGADKGKHVAVKFECAKHAKNDPRFRAAAHSNSDAAAGAKMGSFKLFGHEIKYKIKTPFSRKITLPGSFASHLKITSFKQEYTPRQSKHIVPLDKQQMIDSLDRQRRLANDIDDTDYEGETDGHQENPDEDRWARRLDQGSEHSRLTRSRKEKAEKALNNVPYPDAGVEREANEKMYDFFNSHPQYHLPEARHMTAKIWKEYLDEVNGVEGSGLGKPIDDAEDGSGESMWKKCRNNLPTRWPNSPNIKCTRYAVTPVGYWGCDMLFEDGTCGKVKFYPTIRWDGLDAYPVSEDDRSSEYAPMGNEPPSTVEYHGSDVTSLSKA